MARIWPHAQLVQIADAAGRPQRMKEMLGNEFPMQVGAWWRLN